MVLKSPKAKKEKEINEIGFLLEYSEPRDKGLIPWTPHKHLITTQLCRLNILSP